MAEVALLGYSSPNMGAFSGGRLHRKQTSISLGLFSGYTRGQTTKKQTSLPLGPFSGYTRGQTTKKQTSLPLGPFSGYTRGQTTQKQTSLPLGPFSGTPGDRLQRKHILFDHGEMIFFRDWAIKCTAFPTSRSFPQNMSIFNVFSVGGNE